ncbi:hypothetical protein RN01_03965 [Cupriavidus sp. SHE]|jgi:hypothetical protein|uniref:Uncharacterized protein n=1 Tax=Cupriavidus metallidurans TaxID=119219 RepID=A0A2L0XBF9_9BURK|nr:MULTISPECIES: hypothetical protein [Cupriavidus]AVA37414.1 hypothetical protein C3Z06_29785 [Cupriavidus metallidurans]KWR85967.1 hypothetical protein RN01_03965 [Cupriavidus sp. SHE]QBP11423.1 hypothetical protein DDF84_017570 [Cupriavidus metallidurans]
MNMSLPASSSVLSSYQEAFGVSSAILSELQRRGGPLPLWAAQSAKDREDWLYSLHEAVTEWDWPQQVREASAGLLDKGSHLGLADIGGTAATIMMPISTPGFLRVLLEMLGYPFVSPLSSDPQATTLLDGRRMDTAAREFERTLGMIHDTGYLDARAADVAFGGAVTTGVRFLYYHELGHVMRSAEGDTSRPSWLVPEEEYLVEELVADQFAFVMLTLELRRHPIMQPSGFAGIALALAFVAAKEFASTTYGGGRRTTKNATHRMHRLLFWAAKSAGMGVITEEAVAVGKCFWDASHGLFARVQSVPSPLFSLLLQTAMRPVQDWPTASLHILRWCAFGDRSKVVSTIRSIRDEAQRQASQHSRAEAVLKLIEFVLADTNCVRVPLGLAEALD